MKVLKIILITLLALIILLVSFYAYFGGFKKMNVQISIQGGEVFLYENVIGNYGKSGEIMNEMYEELLNNEEIATTKGLGIYYDNPKEVAQDKLRSEVGCIVENVSPEKMIELGLKYNMKAIPVGNYVYVEFPYKGMMSIMIGIMKAYPVLNKYIKKNNLETGGPMMEIYDMPNKKIIYRQELKTVQ